MGKHDGHLPRKDLNRKSEGMGTRLGRQVARAQGQETKADAKAAKANDKQGKG